MPMRLPLWGVALATTLAMQINASMLDQGMVVLAPLLMEEFGLPPERVGVLSTCSAFGVVLFLLFGAPFIARFGAVRTLQGGALLAATGAAILGTGTWWPALLMAALFIGIGYGPVAPAGSRILASSAPARHRSLIFSIKQAGAPLGGAVAAVMLAPIAAAFGWQVALYTAVVISVTAAVTISPLRRRLDPAPAGNGVRLFSIRNGVAPLKALLGNRQTTAISCLAFSLALVQSCLFSFSVTYLSTAGGMSLAEAALAYALMQGAGATARIALGWLADRTGTPTTNLLVQAVIAALLVSSFGLMPSGSPFWIVGMATFALGFCAVSWNGIFMAEISRLSPPDRIAEATAGGALVAFFGYLIGPLTFSLLVSFFGDYTLPFAIFGGQLLANALVTAGLLARRRRGLRERNI